MEREMLKEGSVSLLVLMKSFFATTLSFAVWLIGGFDGSVLVLLCLMLLDYVSGLRVGYIKKNLNSKRIYKGLNKKMMVLAIVCGSALMNRLVPEVDVRRFVIIFYGATEFLSVIENGSKCGVKFPKKLRKALEQLREE